MSTSGEGDQKKGHFEHGRINFFSCIYWVNILRNFGIFLAELVYLFRNFGILDLKNSGNPVYNTGLCTINVSHLQPSPLP
jgi:hypothetical protein